MVIGTSRCAHVLCCLSVGWCSGRIRMLDALDHRCGIQCTGDAQRSGKSSPADCFCDALWNGMQPRTPPRQSTCWVNGDGIFAVPGRYSYHSKQFDGQLSLPASDARPYRSFSTSMRRGRSLALDHGLVYLHPDGAQNHPTASSRIVAQRRRASLRAPPVPWHRAPARRPPHRANLRGCRSATR
jgi:hypothetical protein